uniref:Succinate-semialdehyde dehydrogenase, mitochondrial n=1 Tax=Meloidogyne hapla TaxID=6305 RepID=A0A1I8BBB7_MELHA
MDAIQIAKRGFKTELLPRGGRAFINGKWIDASNGHRFDVLDPYSNETIIDVSNCGPQDAQIAVAAARKSFSRWANEFTAKERGAILHKCFELMKIKEQQLAELLTMEQGKPLAESKAEIQYSASFFEWYAGESRRIYGQIVSPSKLNRQHLHLREPVGVVAVITPWNFPCAMISRKVGAALAAGCTVIVKPAEDTPLSALALAEISQQAGVPSGVFNVIPADRENTAEISKFICSSHDVDCISFTGSSAVGKILLSQSASTVKRICLELGGNAPFIVFKSADLDKAVQGAIASKFRCSGQTCVSANRFFIEKPIYEEFLNKLQNKVEKLKCGNGMEKNVDQGPLINKTAVEKVSNLLKDALGKGAELISGGEIIPDTKIFKPTIITNVNNEMEIANAEIFGPIIAIQTFETEEEVIDRANSTRNGLAGWILLNNEIYFDLGYVFSKEYSQINRISRAIQVGMIGINEGMISSAEAAFGGVKESGLGREGGAQGIDEFTQWKYVCINTE